VVGVILAAFDLLCLKVAGRSTGYVYDSCMFMTLRYRFNVLRIYCDADLWSGINCLGLG
jgi:hypothetical protein